MPVNIALQLKALRVLKHTDTAGEPLPFEHEGVTVQANPGEAVSELLERYFEAAGREP